MSANMRVTLLAQFDRNEQEWVFNAGGSVWDVRRCPATAERHTATAIGVRGNRATRFLSGTP